MRCNCCPGVVLSIAALVLGMGTAAITSYLPPGDSTSCCFFSRNPAKSDTQSTSTPGCCLPSAESDQPPAPKPPAKKVEIGKNVFLEIEEGAEGKRRVLIQAYVCLREGQLEQLLTRKNAKEHEAILAADIDARAIHTGLLACKAKAGSPAKFRPKFEPASGSVVKVMVEYKDKKDKIVRVPAQQWIRNLKTGKDLNIDWVFAGSLLIPDPFDPKAEAFYGANSGDVICVANMDTALLDLPVDSDNSDLNFDANTDRIPEVGTPVLIILEPVADKIKK